MKNPGRTEYRIGYVFLLIFLLLTASIFTGGYFAYKSYKKNYRAGIENQLSAIADLKIGQIEGWRKERLGDGQVFYKNDVFSAIVKRYIRNRNDREAKTEILKWVGQVQKAYNYDLMMLLDTQFNTILVFPENKERTHLVIDQKNTDILMSGNIAFQDFYRNNQDQHIYLKVLVPILEDHSPTRLIAVLALRISPEEYLYPLIEKWPTPSRTAESLIIRRDGNSALFLNYLKYQKDAALSLRIPLERKDVLAVKAVLGQTGIVEGIDYRGVPVIASIQSIRNTPWFLVARIDMEEVNAPLKEILWLILGLVCALIIGAGASEGFVWRRQRSRFYQEQYKSAEALRNSEKRYRRLFEAARDGILILDFETGMIVDVNPFLIEMLGYSYEQITGKRIWELGFFKDIVANRNKFLELHENEYVRYEDMPLETKDGRILNVEFISNVYVVESHKVIQCNIRDITERKRAEAALNKLSRAVEQSPVSIVITDLDGAIEYVNPKFVQITGYSLEEAIGKNPRILKSGEKPPEEYKQLWDMITSGSEWQGEFHNKKKNGELYWESAIISPIMDVRGIITHFLAVKEDITLRKEAEAEREKLISELKAALAEVKTLSGLIPICASCKKIRDDNGYWQQVESYIQRHSEAKFTHGLCPDCMLKLYPDYMIDKQKG